MSSMFYTEIDNREAARKIEIVGILVDAVELADRNLKILEERRDQLNKQITETLEAKNKVNEVGAHDDTLPSKEDAIALKQEVAEKSAVPFGKKPREVQLFMSGNRVGKSVFSEAHMRELLMMGVRNEKLTVKKPMTGVWHDEYVRTFGRA